MRKTFLSYKKKEMQLLWLWSFSKNEKIYLAEERKVLGKEKIKFYEFFNIQRARILNIYF